MPRKVAKTAKKGKEPQAAEPTAKSNESGEPSRVKRTAARGKAQRNPTPTDRIRLLEATIANLEEETRTLREKNQALEESKSGTGVKPVAQGNNSDSQREQYDGEEDPLSLF
ncbi:hypothetical protein BO78DRAFT_438766 [Aspergillus sclerotiicarbonarius CBS 121057]|uniref:BZIP domain-containing protein n=1 Tax=Aspergillus sclerotiicarbonarius (strain CBS 121057 / IBT 28362) TaxID=1448318 RepID=A0A319EX71_ASPSB|nr:hypothetical protein BO78DRAFT_438766 [Aspergillus sclerotiicarbonarius CBS 121057]